MYATKFEIICECVSHWANCIVIALICCGFIPAFLCVLAGGTFFVETLDFPRFDFSYVEAKVMYGCTSYIVFLILTRAWNIKGCINFWQDSAKQHRMTIDRMKYGPIYFRR